MTFAVFCFLSALGLSVFLDRLTNTLLLLTTFLFLVVSRYAARYMQGDPGQSRFTLWLCITGSFVFAIILAQNLLLFALAWCGASLSLHHLLQFYKDRPGALLAARKKFLISRLGDACLLAVLVLTRAVFGTWNFQEMFEITARTHPHIDAICVLLVFAALLKSAQFPFHSWLPDTMETPTPVSALMHAGIINAGGILVLRFHPLISQSHAALLILCLVGAFTAAFASVAMLTQTSIKRCLAFSTVGQMGFMLLECGLGAYHLALLHLVAHSLYKAHAFLSSGGAVLPVRRPSLKPLNPSLVLLALAGAAAISLGTASFLGVAPFEQSLLTGIFALAMAQMLWNLASPLGLLLGAALAAVYFTLERFAQLIVRPYPWNQQSLSIALLALFAMIVLAQTQVPRLSQTLLGRHLYVLARNGFYCNTVANRITAALWPVRPAQEQA